MKLKTIFAAVALVMMAACGSPYQATDATVVVAPSTARVAFSTQYPAAANSVWLRYDAATVPIDWELSGWRDVSESDYMVRFDLDNNQYYAWYDANGNWIGSTYEVRDFNTLPTVVSNTVADKYPSYTITNVNREYSNDRLLYEVVLKNDMTKVKLLMDENGTILRSKEHPLQ